MFNWSFIGNSNAVQYLQNSIATNKLAHAYLIHGPANIGKTTLAKNLVASILCNQPTDQQKMIPCNECDNCKQLKKKIHPDIYFVKREEGNKDIKIEQIRELRRQLQMSSFLNSYKIAIIQQAELMNRFTANALLKTLEEPTSRTMIILLTTNPNLLLPTIISRSQLIKLRLVATETIYQQLIKLGAERSIAKNISHLSKGRPGLAIDFWHKKELLTNYQDQTSQLLKIMTVNLAERFKIINSLLKSNSKEITQTQKAKQLISIWLGILRDLLLIKNITPDIIQHIFVTKQLTQLADNYNSNKLLTLIKQTQNIQHYLGQNINPQLALENLVIFL